MAILATKFPTVDQTIIKRALDRALTAITDRNTPQRLAEFYNPHNNYAGATFAGLSPNVPDEFTATDLLATRTLNVPIPVVAIRRFLEFEEAKVALTQKLSALPPHSLRVTEPEDFVPMASLYECVKQLLAPGGSTSSNRWVTASKLVARKRPDLFPVRDNDVCSYLGIRGLKDCTKDWYVFRTIMKDQRIIEEIQSLPEKVRDQAGGAELKLDVEPLRILDAAVWRYANDQKL